MGTLSPLDLRSFTNYPALTNGVQRRLGEPIKDLSLPGASDKLEVQTLPALGADEPAASEVDAFFYQSQFERLAVTADFRQTSGTVALDDGSGETQEIGFSSQQLDFEFVVDYRSETLAAFRERASETVEGLPESQRETYYEVSQRVAARFELSVHVSSVVLEGFSNASDAAAEAGEDGIQQLTDFTEEALKKADEILNAMFDLINDFLSGKGNFEHRLDKLLGELQELADTFPGKLGGQTNGANASIVQLEFNFSFKATVQVESTVVQESDPITLDLDDDGIELTSYRNGATFDITGRGAVAQTAFVTGGDAFLALDRNANGTIDSGLELFGDQRGASNGFEELRKLDSNGDSVIDSKDDAYSRLLLFKDNGDGKSGPGELVSLEQAGISEISLKYAATDQRAPGGNRISQIASFRRANGASGTVVDSVLNYLV